MAAAICGSVVSGCVTPPPGPTSAGPTGVGEEELWEQQDDLQLRIPELGKPHVVFIGSQRRYLISMSITNDSGKPIVIDSLDLIGSRDVDITRSFAVGRPRGQRAYHELPLKPDFTDWPIGAEHPIAGTTLGTAEADHEWGVVAFFEMRQKLSHAFARTWKFTGTTGGERFTDYVYLPFTMCESKHDTRLCRRYVRTNTPEMLFGLRRP